MRFRLGSRSAVGAALLALAPLARADEAVFKALAQGGHAVLMRHAKIARHAKALVLDAGGNCANEENLSNPGRAQAQRLKAALDKAGVRFDAVLASPFCRTRDTARLAFGRADVDANLTALELGTPDQAQARTKAITALLAGHAGKGNVALVTHRPNIDALTMELVEEGEAVVARIGADGELQIVGRISP
jgi:phosphohistidine phosphatase SixA